MATGTNPGLAAVLLAVVAVACDAEAPSAVLLPDARAPKMSDAPLPSRPEVVAQADQLAVAGVRQGGSAGARLTLSAARLRTRLWRLERREADALEAIELYGAASRARWDGSCASTVERALLEGELRADPSGAYRELYRAKSAGAPKACGHIIDAALGVLSGFQPLPSVLAEIDRQVAAEHGDSGAARPASRDPSVRRDNGGQIVVPTLVAQLSKPARITSIERYAAEESARIVVFVTHPTTFDVGFIPAADGQRGPRFYVDIHRAEYHGRPAFDVGGIVERVRIGKQKEASRVVLDLADTVYRKVFYLPEPFRLVIDVSKHAPQRATPGARGPRSIKRVVIDPGHGGHDPGAVGPSGLREKDVTLDIAHRAAPLVARELGIVTLLTRDSDVYVPLDERTARANAFGADLFVSIHCNASEDGNGRGVMTFVLDESRDAVAVRIAARENAASPAAAAELANAMSRVVDASMTASSVHFAELLQKAAQASLSPSYSDVGDQGVKRAGFYVLAGARMPAVLFESSFISNPLGELRLNTGDYRQKMADAIVNAVRAYRDGH